MIPLAWFLFAWIGLAGLFGLLSLITLVIHLKYGLSSFTTYLSAFVFLGVTVIVGWIIGNFVISIDWTQNLDFTSVINSWFNLP